MKCFQLSCQKSLQRSANCPQFLSLPADWFPIKKMSWLCFRLVWSAFPLQMRRFGFYKNSKTLNSIREFHIFFCNEKTALADCFFEEFSYENVNLYKGKLAFLVSTILNAYINKCLSVVLLLIIVIYKINVYELCRFSKTFLKF